MKALLLHMTDWDTYPIQETVPTLQAGREVVFPEFDAFNQRAINQAKSEIPARDVLAEAKSTRQTLIKTIELRGDLSAEAELTLFDIIEDFIEHDHHHEQQIDTFLATNGLERKR